jgi:hypothetical protein
MFAVFWVLRRVIWLIYRVINRYIHGPSGDPRDETQQDGEHGKVGRRSFRRGLPKATFWSEKLAWGPTVSCPNRYPSFSANAFLSKYLA